MEKAKTQMTEISHLEYLTEEQAEALFFNPMPKDFSLGGTDDRFVEWMSGYKWGFTCGVIVVLICIAIVAGVANA